MDVAPVDVTITIDELDLTAVPAARRHVVAGAFERELTRLVAERPPDARPGPELRAAPVAARSDGNPVVFGSALARSVYDALGVTG